MRPARSWRSWRKRKCEGATGSLAIVASGHGPSHPRSLHHGSRLPAMSRRGAASSIVQLSGPRSTRRLGPDARAGQALPPLRLRRRAGDVRARKLARNACAPHLQNKVDGEEGRKLGLDSRYEYFRYKAPPSFDNAALLRWFDEYPVPPPTV